MNRILLSTTLTLAAAAPVAIHAEDLSGNPNRFSFGPRFGLNFKADFQNKGFSLNAPNPGPAAGGANHTYDDGFVLLDGSGNAGGLTWNWGYQNGSQVMGDTMQFHSLQPAGGGSASATDNPQYGAELIYQRILGPLPVLGAAAWGLEGGFGFTDLDLRNDRNGTVPVTTDTFPLNGVLPPGAGYNGTFQGPGALLGDTPIRTTGSAALTSKQRLSGQLFSLRLGPFVEWHFTPQLSLAASVGLTLAPATVDYDFSETAALAGGGTSASSGHSSKTKLLYGPYVGGTVRYSFNRSWDIYVGAQFQSLTDLKQSVGGHTARLDPGVTVYLTAGASWNF